MSTFVAIAALMCVLVMLILAWPFLRRRPHMDSTGSDTNAAVLRDQFAKLDSDRRDGLISDADHAQAQDELRRLALQEVTAAPASAPAAAVGIPHKTLAVLALCIPLAGAGLYAALGQPDGLAGADSHALSRTANVDDMVASLRAKLDKDPSNLKGWAMLARSYKVLDRPAEAADAYARAGDLVQTDPQMLADYADVLATTANGRFDGKPDALIAQALKLDPNHVMALWLAGSSAMASQRYDEAVRLWQRLLPLLPPGSEDAQTLQASIDAAMQHGGRGASPHGKMAATDKVQAEPAKAAAGQPLLQGTVTVAPSIAQSAPAGGTLMLIARAPGQRMPVAVKRVPAEAGAQAFSLDDSNALSRESPLSALKQVEVQARISKSGMAMPEAGDLQSGVQTVTLGAKDLRIVIDQIRP